MDARFGERLRGLRDERGWTLREAAHAARMHPSRLARLERGDLGTPPDELLARLASAFGMTVDEFIARTRAVRSSPLRPSVMPRQVLQATSRIRWTPERVREFRDLADRWQAEDETLDRIWDGATTVGGRGAP